MSKELQYFFLSRKARICFPDCNIRLYDNNSESDYFVFLHQNQNIFFSNIRNQNIFLEKKHNPLFKLNGRSLTSVVVKMMERIIKFRLQAFVERFHILLSLTQDIFNGFNMSKSTAAIFIPIACGVKDSCTGTWVQDIFFLQFYQ
jgi:L-rhamnose mutarotase